MKVIKNTCWGTFGLSQEALRRLEELGALVLSEDENRDEFHLNRWSDESLVKWESFRDEPLYCHHADIRTNPLVIQVVEELGATANGRYASLEVVEIPDDIEWEIDNYDGMETIREAHETW